MIKISVTHTKKIFIKIAEGNKPKGNHKPMIILQANDFT